MDVFSPEASCVMRGKGGEAKEVRADIPGATHSRVDVSTTWHTERPIMEVFPVPDCACAMTSRPAMIGLMARCWMAEGFSKP